jgi:hypothetical protein
MFKVLRSQPVNYGLRGALGLAVVYAIGEYIQAFINMRLYGSGEPAIGDLQLYYFDLFHTTHGMELVSWIPSAAASLLTGLVFGIVFAILFANRSTYSRYVTVGALGWFLHFAVNSILLSTVNMGFFLSSRHTTYLLVALSVLPGSFLGLLFTIAKSRKPEPVRWLIVGTFAYPLFTYFYIQLLFKLGIVETPKMFIALIIMVVIYIGSVLLMAIKCENARKVPWMFIVVAVGHHLIARLIHWQLFHPITTFSSYNEPAFWQFTFQMAMDQSIYGILFGLLIGLALGFQAKSNSPQMVT